MKILIVHAHPEEQSFCSSLKNTAVDYFTSRGDEVRESNLYQMGFNPVGDQNDFKSLENPDFFKYQLEQVNAWSNDLFVESLKSEMDKLAWCDVLIFNFPLWWFGLPAILKGWVDRVFAMGFVYGNGKGVYDNGVFKDKTAFLTITTGGPEQAYNGGKNGDLDTILFPVQHGMFYFAGMTVLPPFVCFSPARISDEERELELKRYRKFLSEMDKKTPIYTNK
ncbi:MAG: NAD(P)H-dependent oxidoreductase [Flavobacteriales bacterium]|nr:NAD(P)H-dependent oxidoreductase [Flavobacteriales bacterium]